MQSVTLLQPRVLQLPGYLQLLLLPKWQRAVSKLLSDTAVRLRLRVKGSSTDLHNRQTYDYSKAWKALLGAECKVRAYSSRTEHADVILKKLVLAARGKTSYHNLLWERKGISKSHVYNGSLYFSLNRNQHFDLHSLLKQTWCCLTQCQLRLWLYYTYFIQQNHIKAPELPEKRLHNCRANTQKNHAI